MKRLITLAAAVALLGLFTVHADEAEAGKGKGKRSSYGTAQSSPPRQSPSQFVPPQQSYGPGRQQSPFQRDDYPQSQFGARQGPTGSPVPVETVGLSRVPRFGFSSQFGWRYGALGEHVTRVNFGSPAQRLGIETGDAVVAVNGRQLRTANCWYNAIDRAAKHDGWVTLKIRDGRTGGLAYRTANLFRLNVR